MYIVTLSEAKKHLNIESYFTDDDSYISSLIDVAFVSIKNRCNNWWWVDSSGVTATSDFADFTITGTTIPLAIKHAILLMVGNLYANREPVSFAGATVIPYTIDYLISPYINYEITTTTTTSST